MTSGPTKIEVKVNGELMKVAKGSTIACLLDGLKIPVRGIAVEINHEIQPAESFAKRVLAANDTLEIVTLVGGG